ncbi:unnamed protein product [Diplocarpon coronariae]|uniref:Uncharacterized protein n=1 Tax=Diplocarpon coronariae TaxID=2795749 RepID=A0A218YYR2_9HELO|nr:hypothetical protein B2J93_8707 [Marssonina coronariae]
MVDTSLPTFGAQQSAMPISEQAIHGEEMGVGGVINDGHGASRSFSALGLNSSWLSPTGSSAMKTAPGEPYTQSSTDGLSEAVPNKSRGAGRSTLVKNSRLSPLVGSIPPPGMTRRSGSGSSDIGLRDGRGPLSTRCLANTSATSNIPGAETRSVSAADALRTEEAVTADYEKVSWGRGMGRPEVADVRKTGGGWEDVDDQL